MATRVLQDRGVDREVGRDSHGAAALTGRLRNDEGTIKKVAKLTFLFIFSYKPEILGKM